MYCLCRCPGIHLTVILPRDWHAPNPFLALGIHINSIIPDPKGPNSIFTVERIFVIVHVWYEEAVQL